MSEKPQYPSSAWQPVAALALGVAVLLGSIHFWKPALPLLQREYLWSYVSLSVNAPRLHPQAVIMNGDHLAELNESGRFHREKRTVDPALFRQWLSLHIYEGRNVWLFAWVPEVLTLLFFVPAMVFALLDHQRSQKESWDGKLKRGARIISHFEWNRLIPRQRRGFWIETK